MTRFICIDPFPQHRAAQFTKESNCEVITPSRLASRAIAAQHHPLYNLAVKQLERQGQRVVSPLQAQALFRSIVQDTLQPTDLLGTARAWMPAMRALLKSCSKLEASSLNLSQRTVSLIEVAQKYQIALHEDALVDPSELYWRAAELELEPQQLLIYGYFQLQQDELAWINQIAATGSVLFLPVGGSPLFAGAQASLTGLKQKGWELMADSSAAPLPTTNQLCQAFLSSQSPKSLVPRSAAAHAYSTFDAEIRGTLAQIKVLLNEGTPAREIAIVTKDERAYGPQLIDIAWEYGVPLRALYSTPLLTTRLGAWITLLMNVLDTGFPFEATAKLLSHPMCSNPDSGFWAIARLQHPRGFNQWREVAAEHLSLDLGALAQVNQVRRRDTWVDWWQKLFNAFDLRRRCARWARESIAFNTLGNALVELSKPEEQTLSWHDFRQQLQDLLESLSVPAQPGRGGVELHSPASVIGAQYPHLFVIGMADGSLPPPVSNDAVLDFFERQQLREQGVMLPIATDLFRQEALSFYFLLQTATDQITFSYPKLKERKEQLPSPYLGRMALQVTEPPEQPIASLEEMRRYYLRKGEENPDPVLGQAVQAFQVEQYRESAQPANEYDGVIGVPFDYSDWTFSVSQLTSLGQCPFKWFVDKVLKLGSPAEVEDDLSPSLRGSLYHKAVELLVQAVQDNAELALTDPDLLQEKFLEAERAVKLPVLLNWEVRRKEHLRQLLMTLQKPDFWPANAKPIALEQRFEGEWQGLRVTGRVDRIDETPSGLVLIDYKTGSSAPKGIKDANGKVSIDLQLPLYQEIAVALYPGESVVDAQYFSLTKGKKLSVSSKAPPHELPAAIENCKSALNAGSYPVQPDAKREACTYCDFDLLCRQGNRLARKENSYESN